MRIGTGWPPPHAFAQVPHHGYGVIQPDAAYSAARFVRDAREQIEAVCGRGRAAIVVGGTGFYVEALTGSMPLDRPPPSDELRARLRREAAIHPADVLYEWLRVLDPQSAANTAPGDRYRVVRHLETVVARRAGGEIASARVMPQAAMAFSSVVLTTSRDVLAPRIAERVREMFAGGLVDEALSVRRRFGDAPALTGLGYREALAFADGLTTRDEALAALRRRTMQYAKRQQTWFRRMRDARRIASDDIEAAAMALHALAREFFAPN